jgi:hypothetical protein
MKQRLLGSWHKMEREDFLRYLEASIACRGHRRTIRLLGKVCTKGITDNAVWYLRLRQIKTCGSGIVLWHGGIAQCHEMIFGVHETFGRSCSTMQL